MTILWVLTNSALKGLGGGGLEGSCNFADSACRGFAGIIRPVKLLCRLRNRTV